MCRSCQNISIILFPLHLENTHKTTTFTIQDGDVKYAGFWPHVLLFFLLPYNLFPNYPAGSLHSALHPLFIYWVKTETGSVKKKKKSTPKKGESLNLKCPGINFKRFVRQKSANSMQHEKGLMFKETPFKINTFDGAAKASLVAACLH